MPSLTTRQSETAPIAEDFVSPASRRAPAIAFFGHDSDESTVIKRAQSFQAQGAAVTGFMFRRERNRRDGATEWRNIAFGTTVERNYMARVPKLGLAILKTLRHRGVLRQCDIIYARNLDMLLIAVAAKWLSGAPAPVVYEVLDIQRVFLGQGLTGKLFRWAEHRLMGATSLLVVSAPEFVTRYFQPVYGFDGPWFLLENKLPDTAISASALATREMLAPGPPWVIGMFGVLRCARSLDILSHVAEQLGDRVRISLRGILSEPDISAARIEAICRRLPNVVFGGPYVNPRDLPEIYGKIHFIWAADFLDPGGNSEWLLTNRIYEGGLLGAVLLAARGNAIGRMVERERLGFALDEPLKEAAADFIDHLDSATYLAARERVRGADRSLFVDETDTKNLIRRFGDLAASRPEAAVAPLRILAPTRYPWLFNGPRHSANHIERRSFLPMNRLWRRFEAITVFNPLPPRRFDLIHAFNRIPVGLTPFVIGFESHLPRAYGMENTGYFRWLSRTLAGGRCRRIIAISDHAARTFLSLHGDSGLLGRLEPKLGMRYPNIEIPAVGDAMAGKPAEPLVLAFIGNHFGRKGGCVAVRLAEMACARGMPLEVNIVSTLETGPQVWTDPVRPGFFDRYLSLLTLPNVRHCRGLANAEVQQLLRRSHLSILTTFSDTFGYSAIESMANWTPVLGTRQSALPEFIDHGTDGLLFDLPLTELGDWVHSGSPRRDGAGFEKIYADEIERLAEECFAALAGLLSQPAQLMAMRRAARAKAVQLFCSRKANAYWDQLYRRVAEDEEGWPDEAH